MKKIMLIFAAIVLGNSAFAQVITTIAGNNTPGYTGDGYAATNATLDGPAHIVVDHYGNTYFTDYYNNVIRKIDTSGIIKTFAGTGTPGYGGDNGSALSAMFNGPNGLSTDKYGNLYVADQYNSAIRKIDTSGIITTVAGTGTAGYNGENIPATSAMLNNPTCVIVDDSGKLYIADIFNERLRVVKTLGMITSIAGTGAQGYSGDNGPATAATFDGLGHLDFDKAGNLYVIDQSNQLVRKIDMAGIVTTFAGNGVQGYSSDGIPATASELNNPSNTVFDYSGRLFICDSYNNRIRRVDSTGVIYTAVGNGVSGYMGDLGLATSAELNQPWGLTFDDCGNLYIGDAMNNVVRKVTYFTGMPAINGPMTIGTGWSINLSIALGGGTWSSGSPSIATVGSSTGVVTGVSIGTAVITFTNMCGSSTYTVTVHSSVGVQSVSNGNTISVIPNPSKGEITVRGNLPGVAAIGNVTIDIMDMTGRKIYSDVLPVSNGSINSEIVLNNNIANGLYIIKLRNDNVNEAIRFSLDR